MCLSRPQFVRIAAKNANNMTRTQKHVGLVRCGRLVVLEAPPLDREIERERCNNIT